LNLILINVIDRALYSKIFIKSSHVTATVTVTSQCEILWKQIFSLGLWLFLFIILSVDICSLNIAIKISQTYPFYLKSGTLGSTVREKLTPFSIVFLSVVKDTCTRVGVTCIRVLIEIKRGVEYRVYWNQHWS
jgi:hypothetical protein